MTSYDRGSFVDGRTLTIEPCANGTFLIMRGRPSGQFEGGYLPEAIAFSSANDMLRLLNSEFDALGPKPVEVKTLFETADYQDNIGTVRLEHWPEGLILWAGGVIVWRSWKRAEAGV